MLTAGSISAARLVAALSVLSMVLLASTTPLETGAVSEVRVNWVSAELAEADIESLGSVQTHVAQATPAPRAGRLRVRESDRIGPARLHLPPPVLN
ncbi:MAG: hypothetical protein MK101_08665 [Phycisphaerales bacterium]|nr:hypothetical protein [Phycisphaerales bacterium]